MPRRIFTARKILVASTGVAAVSYFLLARRSREFDPPVGNLMPAPPPPVDAGAEPQLSIDAKTIERVARGELQMALVRIDASNEVEYVAQALPKSVRGREVKWTLVRGFVPGQKGVSAVHLPVDDARFIVGHTYVVVYRETGSGKTLPFALEIAGLDDTNGRDLAYAVAYARRLDAEKAKLPKPACNCPPGDPLCECL
jgi:hypothetical protein